MTLRMSMPLLSTLSRPAPCTPPLMVMVSPVPQITATHGQQRMSVCELLALPCRLPSIPSRPLPSTPALRMAAFSALQTEVTTGRPLSPESSPGISGHLPLTPTFLLPCMPVPMAAASSGTVLRPHMHSRPLYHRRPGDRSSGFPLPLPTSSERLSPLLLLPPSVTLSPAGPGLSPVQRIL